MSTSRNAVAVLVAAVTAVLATVALAAAPSVTSMADSRSDTSWSAAGSPQGSSPTDTNW